MDSTKYVIEFTKHQLGSEVLWSGSMRRIVDTEDVKVYEPLQGPTGEGVIFSIMEWAAKIDFGSSTVFLRGIGQVETLDELKEKLEELLDSYK